MSEASSQSEGGTRLLREDELPGTGTQKTRLPTVRMTRPEMRFLSKNEKDDLRSVNYNK